jgi:PAS domain S-box-containing protein
LSVIINEKPRRHMIPSNHALPASSALQSAIVRNPLVVSPDATVIEAIAKMSGVLSSCHTSKTSEAKLHDDLLLGARSSCVIVVEDNRVVGILSERDVVRLSAQQQPLECLSMREVMAHPVISLHESALTDLFSAVNLLQQHQIRHLPILDGQDRLVGLVTREGLMQPLEFFKLAETLEAKVVRLELEKIALLENRTAELECQVEARTTALKTKAKREKLSAELALQIRSSLSLQTILQTTVDQVRQVLGCSRVNIWRFETDQQITVVAESTESPFSLVGEYVSEDCFKEYKAKYGQGYIRVVSDVETITLTDCHRQLLERLQTRSKILAPLLCEGKLWGFLNAVESHSARDWQPQEVELLQALSVELAIALQQSITHQRLEDELSERKQTEALLRESEQRSARAWQQLQNLIAGTAATTGENFFPALTHYMAEALGVDYAIVTEEVGEQLQSLGYWANGSLQANFSFYLSNTPCEQALQQGEFYCESGVQQQFPEDLDLVEMGADSYLGFALRGSQGKSIGNLCLLDRKPFEDLEQAKNLLRVFAARASAELERERATHSLERLNRQLEHKVEERTAALQASEERWQLALKGANDGIWDWDLRSNKIYFSSRWKAIRGFGKNEIGDSWEEWLQGIHSDDKDRLICAMQEHLAGKTKFFEIEYRVRRKDDSYIWVLDRGQALKNSLGQAIRISGSETDITQRKLAEQTIQQQANREALLREITQRIRKSLDLQTIFDTACEEIRQVVHSDRVGVFRFRPESNCNDGEFVAESVREEFSSVLNIKVHDHCLGDNYASLYLKGRFFAVDDIYDSNLSECHFDILAQFEVRANLVMPLLCGEQLWGLLCVHQCANPRQWKQSEIDLTQQIANQLAIALQQANLVEQLQQELRERQQAQQQLTERHQQLAVSNEELARATRLKDEFLANMSHELRTPLNAILGMTEGLQEQVFGKISNEQTGSLGIVVRYVA